MNQKGQRDRGKEGRRDKEKERRFISLSFHLYVALALWVGVVSEGYAMDGAQTRQKPPPAKPSARRPVVFTTAPKLTVAKLQTGGAEAYDIRGKLSFTVTAANSDDTVAGEIKYTIPDDARQKIGALTGKPPSGVPSSITHKGAIAAFQKMTAAPIIHLEIRPMEVDVAGVKMRFNRIVLDINARETSDTKFTNDEMESLFTSWARQIGSGRLRRGVIAMINRRIAGQDDQ